MIAGIILAAGEGKRINKHKLTLPLGSRTIIDRVLEAATKSRLDKIVLITKPDAHEVVETGKKYGIAIVSNPDYKEGMSTSIKKALLELDKFKRIDGFCVLLGDQPFINPSTIDRLIEAFHSGKKEIIVPSYQGKNGNPVLFDIAWKEDFMGISGDTGGRVLIKKYPEKVRIIEMSDNTILFDIDKEEDYIKAKAYLKILENREVR